MGTTPALPSRISTIVLGVSDLERSLAFYTNVLELELKGRHPPLAFLDLGDITLMLSTELARHFTPLAGAVEMVLPVASVVEAHRLLDERGCTFLNSPREFTTDAWGATLTDPDGHKLTLMGPR